MNAIRYNKYAPDGRLLLHHKHSGVSYMNMDYQMRELARHYGKVLVGGAATVNVGEKSRTIEWIDDDGNFHVLAHRIERRITYIEIQFKPLEVKVRVRRGTEALRVHEVNYASVSLDYLFSWVRRNTECGRMRIVALAIGNGIAVIPERQWGG